MQKYKIFFNKAKLSLTITDEKNVNNLSSDNCILYQGKESIRDAVAALLEKQCSNDIYITEKQKDAALEELFSHFDVEKAAGGLVENAKGELLVIRRFGYYDFPKGHVEAGESWEETALREVEEETAVSGLRILHELPVTYHIFMKGSRPVLKETHWFAMRTDYQGNLWFSSTRQGVMKIGWDARFSHIFTTLCRICCQKPGIFPQITKKMLFLPPKNK